MEEDQRRGLLKLLAKCFLPRSKFLLSNRLQSLDDIPNVLHILQDLFFGPVSHADRIPVPCLGDSTAKLVLAIVHMLDALAVDARQFVHAKADTASCFVGFDCDLQRNVAIFAYSKGIA
jgi:hypothetical protein